MSMQSPFALTSPSALTSKMVQVDMIEGDIAHVVDQFNTLMQIPLSWRLGKGARPQVGELWTVERDSGASTWVFKACIKTANPEVNGDIPVGSALDQVVTGLASQGLLHDSGQRVVDWSPWLEVMP